MTKTAKTRGKKTNTVEKKSESRDISAYVCRAMVYGAISGHGITRDSIEKICAKYSDDNPKVDITKLPIVMVSDDGTPENRAIVFLAKKYCKKCSVVSTDGKTVLIVGTAAKEIVSKLDFTNCGVQKLKTKMRVSCTFPLNKKLKCFDGEKVSDHIKTKKQ